MAYDFNLDHQYVLLGAESGLSNPVDIVFDTSTIMVLDAGISAIFIFNQDQTLEKTVPLRDETGEKTRKRGTRG